MRQRVRTFYGTRVSICPKIKDLAEEQCLRAGAACSCSKAQKTLNWGTKCLESAAYHEAQREQSYRAETATSHTAGTEADPVSCTYSHGFQRDCQRTQACQRLCVGAQHTNQDTCSKPSSC